MEITNDTNIEVNSSLKDGEGGFTINPLYRCSDYEKKKLLEEYTLVTKVNNLSKQLYEAVKEWALHAEDSTIKYATVHGNVLKDEKLTITREVNVIPAWFRMRY